MISKEYDASLIMSFVGQEFSKWLQSQLEQRDWTQSDLARRAGLSRGTISNVMNGERGVGEETAQAIARAFHLPPADVFRIAGLLPVERAGDPLADEARHIMQHLSEERRRQAIFYLRTLAQTPED